MKNKGFIKKWLLISLIILVVFSLSGVGVFWAYKNGKFAQAQNPNPSASPTDIVLADRSIIKTVYPDYINLGETFNINLTIPGMKDASAQMAPAEIMFVIDSSQSMDRPAYPNRCSMYVNNDPSQPKIRPHAQRLCYAKTAAVRLMDIAARRNLPLKAGYQLFSSYSQTLRDYDPDNNFYRFMGLTDINDNNARADLEAKMIGPCTGENCQMQIGTAMGLGIEKAVRELKKGDPNAAKYIILLSDGAENIYPSTSGCQNSNWPSSWPPSGDQCQTSDIRHICDRLENRVHPNNQIITPAMVTNLVGLRNQMRDYCQAQNPPRVPCAFSCKEIKDVGGGCNVWSGDPYCSMFQILRNYGVYLPWYPGSPAEEVQLNGIQVFSVGYYGGGSNTDEPYMIRIAENLYPQEPGGGAGPLPAGYFKAESDSDYLYQIMEDILGVISRQNTGAPFTMIETLPVNASVTANNISVWRDGVNLNLTPRLGRDGQDRQTITLDIVPGNYSGQTNPNTQSFEVRIQNIQYNGAGCFDADQNYDANGVEQNPKPSYVTWRFPISGQPDVTKYMPRGRVCAGTQYSGDVYGVNIQNYAFPGIDVTAARGQNSSNGAIWQLSSYRFSNSSYSNYNNFKSHLDKVTADLETRARNVTDPNRFFNNPNPNPDTNPIGGVWHAAGDLTISGQHTIGRSNNQRATVIVDGNLTFNNQADLSRLANTENNLLFIVKGNVTIGADVKRIENVAIVAHNGTITIENSSNTLSIKGFLAAGNVVLRSTATSSRQRINYDTSFNHYAPPGLSSLDLPIFKEVAP